MYNYMYIVCSTVFYIQNIGGCIHTSTENISYAYIFDADSLDLIDSYSLGTMVPFHAHSVICTAENCFSNP